MTNEPFGRQPETVNLTITGSPPDVEFWSQELSRTVDKFSAHMVRIRLSSHTILITIHPRAVND